MRGYWSLIRSFRVWALNLLKNEVGRFKRYVRSVTKKLLVGRTGRNISDWGDMLRGKQTNKSEAATQIKISINRQLPPLISAWSNHIEKMQRNFVISENRFVKTTFNLMNRNKITSKLIYKKGHSLTASHKSTPPIQLFYFQSPHYQDGC